MEKTSSHSNFTSWLWNGFRWFTGLSAKFRSDKEKRLGAFLLITQVIWYILPSNPLNLFLVFTHIILGFSMMIHGQYLASQEEAERFETFKMFFDRVTGKAVSPKEYAEQHRRKKRDMR
ncbi:hypothetical protein ES703_87724 [subsurface metagenome]